MAPNRVLQSFEVCDVFVHDQRQAESPPLSPTQENSLQRLLQRYPIMWQGELALKHHNAASQMHFVSGNLDIARDSLPANSHESVLPLRISQQMSLDDGGLEEVTRKMQIQAEHCVLLALPSGQDDADVLQQGDNLRNGFINYLQLKQAAGILSISCGDQPAFLVHVFPSCDFANGNLTRIAPDLFHGVADIAHLLIVITKI